MSSNSSLTDETRRIVDRVLTNPKPTAIASLGSHKNLIFNEALIQMTGKSAEELRQRVLPLCWIRPEEMQPDLIADVMAGKALPPQMAEMLRSLRQQGKLDDWQYYLWNNGTDYGACRACFEHVKFQGEDCRIVTTLGFDTIRR